MSNCRSEIVELSLEAPENAYGIVTFVQLTAPAVPQGVVTFVQARSADKVVDRAAHGVLQDDDAATIAFHSRSYAFAITNLDETNDLWFRFDDQQDEDIHPGDDNCGVVRPRSTREVHLIKHATRAGRRFVQLVSDGGGAYHVEAVK